ncbi:MAG: ABC-type tungstate transport system, permease protein [uncultured Thiotrichaceae bacterium]|uniref:ABC-type tungstate transport system, permease protein n=1 Tax=uncultured Thiotrichaceae bacterium TaxID=298394 RepID=A0A6S6TYG1_9GAMM|nr:MAG: ABC-type tungstate transport system, permease protein [uncultured Thiotrichaceae bacterium]
MESISATIIHALSLLLTGDAELWTIIGISFSISTTAILIAAGPAILCGFFLAYTEFPGRRLLISLFNTLLAVPAVVVGLTFYILLSRQGPLGDWKLLFTQTAMVLGQIALCFPLLVAMSHAAFQAVDKRAWETARTIGANPFQAFFMILREVRFGVFGALVAGYGRIIAEVGASMMLGGNILHYTRNIPTAIVLETSKGELAQGIALGMVLIVLSFILITTLHYLQGKGRVE